jgi:hypothetical protein
MREKHCSFAEKVLLISSSEQGNLLHPSKLSTKLEKAID